VSKRSKYEDEDGIDGPFEREMARAMQRDAARGVTKSRQVPLRATEEELAQIDARAAEAGLTRSAWLIEAGTRTDAHVRLRAELGEAKAEVVRLQKVVAKAMGLLKRAGDQLFAAFPRE